MKTWWLAIPFVLLAALAGAKHYLYSVRAGHLPSPGNIKWSKWLWPTLARHALACLLFLLSVVWLSGQLPWLGAAAFAALAVFMLVAAAVLAVLWLAGVGYRVPAKLYFVATAHGGWGNRHPVFRVSCWAVGFGVSGAAALSAWCRSGNHWLLAAGFLLLTLGFLSLAKALFRQGKTDKKA